MTGGPPPEALVPLGPVIDVHVHVSSPELIAGRAAYLERDDWFRLLYENPKSRLVTCEQVLCEMDDTGVDRSVIFGFAFRDQGLCREANDYVIDAVHAHPDRFTGFACVSPEVPGAVNELERCLDAGLAGCGELFPDGQQFDLVGSPGLDLIADVLRERGLPLNLHANEPVGHVYAGKGDNTPGPCYEFAHRHPQLDIILAHMGGGLFFYELMTDVQTTLARVYYDTAAVPYLYRRELYSIAATTAGAHKLLFGTDYPLLSPRRYLAETEILDATFRQALFGGNAARLLGLE